MIPGYDNAQGKKVGIENSARPKRMSNLLTRRYICVPFHAKDAQHESHRSTSAAIPACYDCGLEGFRRRSSTAGTEV